MKNSKSAPQGRENQKKKTVVFVSQPEVRTPPHKRQRQSQHKRPANPDLAAFLPRSTPVMLTKAEGLLISDFLTYTGDWRPHGEKARQHDAEWMTQYSKGSLCVACLGFAPKKMRHLMTMGELVREAKRFKGTPTEEYRLEDSPSSLAAQFSREQDDEIQER